MPVSGQLDFKGLRDWMEDIAAAEQSVDDVVTEILSEVKPFVADELERNLQSSSEQWIPDLATTIDVSDVQREGNNIFIEASAGGDDQDNREAASAKEYGTGSQAAEPFFRPTFRGSLLKNKLKAGMKAIADRFGLS